MVAPVDQRDAGAGVSQLARHGEAAEAAAEYDHARTGVG